MLPLKLLNFPFSFVQKANRGKRASYKVQNFREAFLYQPIKLSQKAWFPVRAAQLHATPQLHRKLSEFSLIFLVLLSFTHRSYIGFSGFLFFFPSKFVLGWMWIKNVQDVSLDSTLKTRVGECIALSLCIPLLSLIFISLFFFFVSFLLCVVVHLSK